MPDTSTLTGIGVSPGIAVGPVARLAAPPVLPALPATAVDPGKETLRAHDALEAVAVELDRRAAIVTGPAAGVLGAEAMMARDPTLAERVAVLITEGLPAAHAVDAAIGEYQAQLAAAGPYLAERVADLQDIRNRALAELLGVPMPGVPDPGHPFVLIAEDLAPADTATLDPLRVIALVTERGGPTSHTAIVAKALGLPAVVSCAAAARLGDGATVLVDGAAGTVVVDPDQAQLAHAHASRVRRAAALARSSGPGRTADGHPVKLLTNVGSARDLPAASAAGAEGVGLFRTEFLFLDRASAPSEAEQQAAYAEVFAGFAGRPVVVRTLDAGADKPLAFVDHGDEANPALGVRGYRVARKQPELLAGQLRAIAAAARDSTADVWVMAPMVSTSGEGADFAELAHATGLATAGVMVEVPGAALQAGPLLERVDFVSLGTNDLAQYTMATDRMAGDLADLLDHWQPALLRLIAMTATAGRDASKPVGVCGEAASDPLMALVLVGLGVTSLSMAPGSVAEVRLALAAHSRADCERLAGLALTAPDAPAARAAVLEAAAPS
jgi:phosphotransferase system enzyme I (PtsI)